MACSNQVAIVYHYLAHYRQPIFNLLVTQPPNKPQYYIYSGIETDRPLRTIDPEVRFLSPETGGLRWTIIKNYWFLKYFLWQAGLINLALNRKINTIIYLGQMYFISTWISAIIAKIMGKRVLMWSHGYIKEENNIKGFIRKIFYKLADGMLLYGERAKTIMINKGFKPQDLYLVYNSLNYDEQVIVRNNITSEIIKERRETLFINPQFPILIFVGRLTPQKKLQMILYAADELRKKAFLCNILFVGEGVEREHLETISCELRLSENIKFVGACYDEHELGLLISLSDICVSPGEVGLTGIHSLTYGTPVITHDDPASQMPEFEVINNYVNGLFFKKDSIADLADKISGWFSMQRNREDIRTECYKIIDELYNPHYQVTVFNNAVQGVSSQNTTRNDFI